MAEQKPMLEKFPDVRLQVSQNTSNIASLTTALADLKHDVHELTLSVGRQADNVNAQLQNLLVLTTNATNSAKAPRETNWMLLAVAAGVLFTILTAVGAAVFAPVYLRLGDLVAQQIQTQSQLSGMQKFEGVITTQAKEIDAQKDTAKILADAVLKQNDKLTAAQIDLAEMKSLGVQLRKELDHVTEFGSASADKRLAIIEAKILTPTPKP